MARIHRGGGARGDRGVQVVDRGSAAPQLLPDRWNPATLQEIRGQSGRSRPTTSTLTRAMHGRIRSRSDSPERGDRSRVRPIRDANLKRRLYEEGLKEPHCEMCGQGEIWRGRLHVDDPRPHQRRARRQPPREPPASFARTAPRLSIRIAVARTGSAPARNCRAVARVRARHRTQRYCSRACGCAGIARSCGGVPSLNPQSRAPALREAACRDRGDELPAPSGASTASPTTPSASGFGSTNESGERVRGET